MDRITDRFAQCNARGEGALVCYLMAGDPNFAAGSRALRAVAAGGADVIELGVPFSDPMADGPVIQQAAIRALKSAIHLPEIFALVRDLRCEYDTPLLLMSYWNPILQYGIERTIIEAGEAGVDGFLISDLPPEEAQEWLQKSRENGLETIFLLAPTSPESRIRLVASEGSGFIYCVSRLGVTGAHRELPADLFALIDKIKSYTTRPVAVGFGISTPEQVALVCSHADGAIVGSALVKIIADAEENELSSAVQCFVEELKAATHRK